MRISRSAKRTTSEASVGSSKLTSRWLLGFLKTPYGAPEQRHRCLLLACLGIDIREGAITPAKRQLHETHSQVRIAGLRQFAHPDLYCPHRGEAGHLETSKHPLRPNSSLDPRMQIDGETRAGVEGAQSALGCSDLLTPPRDEAPRFLRWHSAKEVVGLQPIPCLRVCALNKPRTLRTRLLYDEIRSVELAPFFIDKSPQNPHRELVNGKLNRFIR